MSTYLQSMERKKINVVCVSQAMSQLTQQNILGFDINPYFVCNACHCMMQLTCEIMHVLCH